MKPLDPRLLRYASAVKPFLAAGAVLGLLQTAIVVAFSWFVSQAVVAVVDHRAGELPGYLVGLGVAVVLRSIVTWALEAVAARTAATVKSQLRMRVVTAMTTRGRSWLATQNSARLAILVGPGLDALDEYFAKYLPQLILTALATPLLVIVLFSQDLLSGIIVVCTLPLIPVFMVLIGWSTRTAQTRQWERLASLASGFLDAVNGLSTLKVFGRERRQIRRIGTLTDEYRSETMKVLQVSFLSGFALEMAASLSVALVAVSIGLRLVAGDMGLSVGLFLLLLTPEAYLPLRNVGANYHAAADGVAAAEDVFAVLDSPSAAESRTTLAESRMTLAGSRMTLAGGVEPSPRPRVAARGEGDAHPETLSAHPDVLEVRGLSVLYGDVVALESLDVSFEVGRVTAVVGPSGIGKSTLLAALRGGIEHAGTIAWRATGLAPVRAETAWSGQAPGLLSGTVAANVALGDDIDVAAVVDALGLVGARDIDPGADLGSGGDGLSGGQAQRVALARAVYRLGRHGARLLLVDEPTSALDRETEAVLVAGLRTIAGRGVAVVVVTHRVAVQEAADAIVRIGHPALVDSKGALS